MDGRQKIPRYGLNDRGEFEITDYNHSKPLANFFPGVAGHDGIPMWVFYVNRGQAISSFGTDGKDGAILEFYPANKAWQNASLLGFRTFIKAERTAAGKESFYEPFHNGIANRGYRLTNAISMSAGELSLSERNPALGLEVNVRYFTLPHEKFAALARIVRIRNTGKRKIRLQVLDGLPQVVPYAENNWCLKEMSRTIEAWIRIDNLEHGVPVYRLAVDPGDRPQVIHVEKGNFYLGFLQEGKKSRVIKPIVDPDCIFGPINDFSAPRNFISPAWDGYPAGQQIGSKTPCAFLELQFTLAPGQEKTFNAVVGTVRRDGMLPEVCRRVTAPGYLDLKARQNRALIDELTSPCATSSSSSTFDLYCRQTFLDNALRGGVPLVFPDTGKSRIFYLYSRKHGDPERDYNRFQIQDTYYSQGNGNYRDVNQNRRCDVWFSPGIEAFNIELFMGLIQADGYNPLVLRGSRFVLPPGKSVEPSAVKVLSSVPEGRRQNLLALLESPFTPGEVALFLEENGIRPEGGTERFLASLLPVCEEINLAEHGEGFWTDHWHYNLDLLENYLCLYPDRLRELLFERADFSFFDNEAVVAPRPEKYVLLDGKPRQLHAVSRDPGKIELINSRAEQKNAARGQHGKGEIVYVTLWVKLLCLFVNKYASLDPFGTGVEMEADKPNWFDALNGLPALFGSSSCETFELKRLAVFMIDSLRQADTGDMEVPEEIAALFFTLDRLTGEWLKGPTEADFDFWEKSGRARDDYRAATRLGFSGQRRSVTGRELIGGLERALKKIEAGLAAAFDGENGIYRAYFINEVADYEALEGGRVRPKKFRQKPLPFFLEGQMHALRACSGREEAKRLHDAVKKSELFDRKLRMYKVTAPLASMPEEIGRCRVFAPGWLENESIWLHMEYKYLLELLKQGLYRDFFADFQKALIPFQEGAVYGRSIVENSSFLVSSAFPYPQLHGNGFVARLSGSTAEFLQMWLIMSVGKQPFALDRNGQIALSLRPCLPGWIFKRREKTFACRFLGTIDLVYHNPKLKNTFGAGACRVRRVTVTDKRGAVTVVDSDTIPSPLASRIRSGETAKIEALLE